MKKVILVSPKTLTSPVFFTITHIKNNYTIIQMDTHTMKQYIYIPIVPNGFCYFSSFLFYVILNKSISYQKIKKLLRMK